MRRAAAALAVALACGLGPGAAPARAGDAAATAGPAPIDLPDTPAVITVPASWKASVVPAVEGAPVAAYEGPGGGRVVLTRASAHNPEAWIARYRERYADAVEAGVEAATEGYRRKARTVHRHNGVPCMDLEISRVVDGKREEVSLRFVFFRTYTLTAAAHGPRRDRAAMAAILRSFGPPVGYLP